MWVFDATPLIYLAKVEQLALVHYLDESCVVPEQVYAEVVETGLDRGHPDARRIERAVEDGRFEVRAVEDTALTARLRTNSNLSEAGVAVLSCAATHEGIAVMDETYGRDVAATEGITTRGTAYLVLSLASEGALDGTAARTSIDELIDEGWYCSPDVYAKLVRKLDSISGSSTHD
jgi:predicted nucleic acid-binding protein